MSTRQRKFVLTVVLCTMFGMLGQSAFAIAPVGTPTAGLKTGQWSVGFDYAHGEIDFDIDWKSDFVSGIPKSKAKDMKSDAYLTKFGYGISDDWEFYGFLGAADNRGKIDTDSFDGGHGFSGGFGTKWTFLKDEKLSWGLVYQMGWSQGDDSYDLDLSAYGYGTEKIDVGFKSFDISLMAGPTYEMGNWRVYGGAGLYYFDADIDIDYMDITIVEGDVSEAMFGGYVGAAFDLNESTSLYAEYMLAGDGWMLGTGIVWKF